eukprot:Selendium_serpulae@DN2065_c0_g1_i2.p1
MIWTTFPNHCNTTAFASPHVLSSIAVVFTFVDIFVCSEFVAGERTSSSPHVRDGQSEPAEMEAAKALLGLSAAIEADQSVQRDADSSNKNEESEASHVVRLNGTLKDKREQVELLNALLKRQATADSPQGETEEQQHQRLDKNLKELYKEIANEISKQNDAQRIPAQMKFEDFQKECRETNGSQLSHAHSGGQQCGANVQGYRR